VTGRKYTSVAVALHWSIALLIFCNIILGLGAHYVPHWFARLMIDVHKSIGITVLGLVLVRILWRVTHKPPRLPANYPLFERGLAQSTHVVLYLLMLALPITGWIHDSALRHAPHPLILFWVLPWFRLGFITSLGPDIKNHVRELSGHFHTYFGYALYGVVSLHIIGALKHWLIDRTARQAPG
jgi:cytochrome b561